MSDQFPKQKGTQKTEQISLSRDPSISPNSAISSSKDAIQPKQKNIILPAADIFFKHLIKASVLARQEPKDRTPELFCHQLRVLLLGQLSCK